MSAQLRPIGTIAFASAFLASGLAVSVPANIAFATDCLTAPNSTAPPNSHWYYRTDRTQERKCRHLGTANGPSEHGAAQIVREAPAKPSQSFSASDAHAGPGFKDFAVSVATPNYRIKTLTNFTLSSWNGNSAPRIRQESELDAAATKIEADKKRVRPDTPTRSADVCFRKQSRH